MLMLNGKDSFWLQLEVCREYQRSRCTRSDGECKFAHPPTNVEIQSNGRVTACYDSIKGRCQRETCKYMHPPAHLKDQLLINGRNHLALKNAILQQQQQHQHNNSQHSNFQQHQDTFNHHLTLSNHNRLHARFGPTQQSTAFDPLSMANPAAAMAAAAIAASSMNPFMAPRAFGQSPYASAANQYAVAAVAAAAAQRQQQQQHENQQASLVSPEFRAQAPLIRRLSPEELSGNKGKLSKASSNSLLTSSTGTLTLASPATQKQPFVSLSSCASQPGPQFNLNRDPLDVLKVAASAQNAYPHASHYPSPAQLAAAAAAAAHVAAVSAASGANSTATSLNGVPSPSDQLASHLHYMSTSPSAMAAAAAALLSSTASSAVNGPGSGLAQTGNLLCPSTQASTLSALYSANQRLNFSGIQQRQVGTIRQQQQATSRQSRLDRDCDTSINGGNNLARSILNSDSDNKELRSEKSERNETDEISLGESLVRRDRGTKNPRDEDEDEDEDDEENEENRETRDQKSESETKRIDQRLKRPHLDDTPAEIDNSLIGAETEEVGHNESETSQSVIATSSESQAIEDTNSLKASGFSSTNEQASNEALKANEMGR